MEAIRVECVECGKSWWTAHASPACDRCGSVDIELANERGRRGAAGTWRRAGTVGPAGAGVRRGLSAGGAGVIPDLKSWCRETVVAAFAKAIETSRPVCISIPSPGLLAELNATLAEVPDDNPLKAMVSFELARRSS